MGVLMLMLTLLGASMKIHSCEIHAFSPLENHHLLFAQAKVLGAYKLARFAYDRLQRQKVPALWQDQIDLDMLCVQVRYVERAISLFIPVALSRLNVVRIIAVHHL